VARYMPYIPYPSPPMSTTPAPTGLRLDIILDQSLTDGCTLVNVSRRKIKIRITASAPGLFTVT
jgi:hypothetical protein